MSEEENLQLVTSSSTVDELNAEFYGTYQYPWPPMSIDRLGDPSFEIIMLSQLARSWDQSILPANPAIWVGGCGTNQAALTALRFPKGRVTGSDLSKNSLQTCANTAKQLGIANLRLRNESLTGVSYQEEFDYVICTGVIHHTADPEASLKSLARALKPGGVMQLMVYNRYHRIALASFQKAIRALEHGGGSPDFPLELKIARQLLSEQSLKFMAQQLTFHEEDSALADALIQPLEYSYSVESLQALADDCGLEYVSPYIDQFSQTGGSYLWNLNFSDPDLRDRYEKIPDAQRWQVTNLLLGEKSPMLWFLLQRKDSGRRIPSEREACDGFLKGVFTKTLTDRQVYTRKADGRYELNPSRRPFPGNHPDSECQRILDKVEQNPTATMGEILQSMGYDLSFYEVNRLRLCLTTPAFPFLRSTSLTLTS